MKLVDILARELKEWPNTYTGQPTGAITQDVDGEINTLDGDCDASASQMDGDIWSGEYWTLKGINVEKAEDYKTAIVTRAQWQAAVDALKPEWSGEGLPPVGTVCEIWYAGGDWAQCTVMAHDLTGSVPIAVVRHGDQCYTGSSDKTLRPIRTAEQIEAQERSDACGAMFGVLMEARLHRTGTCSDICEALYDAGYRKQVQP